jgi:hypothetical protein
MKRAYLDERMCEGRVHILLEGYRNRKCILGLMNIRMRVHTQLITYATRMCILGWEIVGMKSAYLGRSLRRWRVRTWVGGCGKRDSILRWKIVEM